MTDNIGKKIKSSAQKVAKQAKKVAEEELEKTTKKVQEQVTGKEMAPKGSSVVDEIVGVGEKDKPVENGKVDEAKSKRLTARLEEELEIERQKRKRSEEEWKREQEEKMGKPQQETERVLVLPSSPQKGPRGPGGPGRKGPKGTGEMIKQKK
jgi:hypothetical protein